MVDTLGVFIRVENMVAEGSSCRLTSKRQRFTQVQAPRVEVKTLLPACLGLSSMNMWLQGDSGEIVDLAGVVWLSESTCP